MKNFNNDDLLFVVAKTDNNGEYDFFYKDELAIRTAFDVICQLLTDKGIEVTLKNSENIDE